MDYCLRGGGWLDEFAGRPDTALFAAMQSGETIGFSLLSPTSPGEAEFRIALHPRVLGRGVGEAVTRATLARGFLEMGLTKIHLIVRKNNPRAARLYERTGFERTGKSIHTIRNKEIEFVDMKLSREGFLDQGRCR